MKKYLDTYRTVVLEEGDVLVRLEFKNEDINELFISFKGSSHSFYINKQQGLDFFKTIKELVVETLGE